LADTDAFRAACTGCKLCSEACSFDVVLFDGPEAGLDEGKAYIDPAEKPCRWCEDFPCIAACPEGALTFGETESPPPMARAEVDLTNCLNSFGVLCDDCATVCPSSIRAIKVVAGIPILNDELCTGCGLCAYHCEADSTAIHIKRIDKE
jgi:ferredoxin